MLQPRLRFPAFLLCLILIIATVHFASAVVRNSDLGELVNNFILGSDLSKSGDSWTGRWFPDKDSEPPDDGQSRQTPMDAWKTQMSMQRAEMMSMDNDFCDNGKVNLTVDHPEDESHFLCSSWNRYIEPNYLLPPMLTKYPIPTAYVPSHRCMNETIQYEFPIPTFGSHRPIWAAWGEYDFLPPQRWIHNLEHGGIVMLYNPCAHRFLVNELKHLVRNCLTKHIITPFKLPEDRPLALVAWGWSLTMATMNTREAIAFIQKHANRAPENIDDTGKYDLNLRVAAEPISSPNGNVCPLY